MRKRQIKDHAWHRWSYDTSMVRSSARRRSHELGFPDALLWSDTESRSWCGLSRRMPLKSPHGRGIRKPWAHYPVSIWYIYISGKSTPRWNIAPPNVIRKGTTFTNTRNDKDAIRCCQTPECYKYDIVLRDVIGMESYSPMKGSPWPLLIKERNVSLMNETKILVKEIEYVW